MEKIRTLEITITKKKKTWCDVTVHGKTDFMTRVRKESCENVPEGVRTNVKGYVDRQISRYGTTFELILCGEDEEKKMIEAQAESIMRDIRERASKEGYFYSNGAYRIRLLGITKYDDELKQLENNVELKKALRYFRSDLKDGYISESAVQKIRSLAGTAYDREIEDARVHIKEEKSRRERERREAERKAGIVHINIPAYRGFKGRPQKGELLYHRGKVYETISSYYHDADGFSIGVMNEEWYSVKAIDVSDEERGKQMLETILLEKQEKERKKAYQTAQLELLTTIMREGELYKHTDSLTLEDIPGEEIMDTQNIYGSGETIRITEDKVYLVKWNHMDGDYWGDNNVNGSGIAYVAPMSEIKELLDRFLSAKDAMGSNPASTDLREMMENTDFMEEREPF